VLYSYTLLRVVPNTVFYLTLGVGEDKQTIPPILVGPNSEKDIRAASDDKGQFALGDIPPGNYYLVVWAPYTWVLGEVSSGSGNPRLIELAPDQSVPLGIVYLSWP
jgi:hypothetical protein